MQNFIIRRVLQGLVTLWALITIVFILSRLTGDPLDLLLPLNATPTEREAFRAYLGLDGSIISQYFVFFTHAAQGDFGDSIRTEIPVTEMIRDRFPATVKLALATAVFAIPVGVAMGVYSAVRRDKVPDTLGKIVALLGLSLPSFWVAIMLILLFAVIFGILPTSGIGGPKHYILPVIATGWAGVAGVLRLTRSSMLEVLSQDYMRTARAKGLSENVVFLRHALKNAAIPVLTLSTVLFATLLTGSVIAETVFAWPGVGRLAFQSITARDFPVVQGIVLLFGTIFVVINLLTDVVYAWIDPRIRYS